ncbi:hypothetical protein HPP92_004944 [Vanilla planifolia]|uniref:Uncharacterized protein n=1 Tax=Vanilla planifolia TaxID=51239 RepID=A0A835VCR2_VANPL|nr:hypothetical protein HPP92_004944 [Vanilla planifolia]
MPPPTPAMLPVPSRPITAKESSLMATPWVMYSSLLPFLLSALPLKLQTQIFLIEGAPQSTQAGETAANMGGGVEEARDIDVDDLVHELLETVDTVQSFADYRRTHRKECFNLVRG